MGVERTVACLTTYSLVNKGLSSAAAAAVPARYGLVYPGMGWVLWREPSDVPDDLVFHINYLGSGALMSAIMCCCGSIVCLRAVQ
jgi:hypothetical protein